jgi:hypothetical protein
LQIGHFHNIAIGDPEATYPRPHEQLGHCTAQCATSDEQDRRLSEPILSGVADLGQQSLALVSSGGSSDWRIL